MKYLLAQPSNVRFQWELDVFLTSLRSLDAETPVVLLFMRENEDVADYFRGRYPNLEVYEFEDTRTQRNYLATVRPYLVWRYLSENPTAQEENYFQVDSDIVFRDLPDFSRMPLKGRMCWASECPGYIDAQYLLACKNGRSIVDKFSDIIGISVEKIGEIPGAGAQWYYSRPTAGLWWHIWQDCDNLYNYLQTVDSDVQKWTAEMWSQLYNLEKFGWLVRISPELDFIRPTDPVGDYQKVKILHNAGVTGPDAAGLFYKGAYADHSPFGEDLSWVDRSKAGWHYARAIEKAYNHNV